MLAVRINPELEQRLARLAKKTGRTKSFYARQAIEDQIDDLEDYYLAVSRLKKNSEMLSLEAMEHRFGLDD